LSSLKQKTLTGLTWSFIDNIAGRGIAFIIGLILARLLTPKDFGLLGMLTIFIAISHSLIDSGFSQAIIRKKNISSVDYSTVFYFNLAVSVLIFCFLFFIAPYVSYFFEEPQLKNLLRILSLAVIFDALSIIQRTILIKRIDFKLQTKISIIANIISGAVGVTMAFKGFGVWSLVVQTLIKAAINSALLWFWNKWIPSYVFSRASFKELFSFGSKLMLVGLINTTYKHVYHIIIGKFFSAQTLGFYTRAHMFSDMPSSNITSVIQRVSYPVMSELQDNPQKLKSSYKKLITNTMLITFVLMLGMAAVAEPMVILLIGEKWRTSILYLQMLCFVGMMYPLHALNLNILNVKGRSDLFLKLEVIKKSMAVPVIIIGVLYGIKVMLVCMIVNTQIAYILNSYWSGKLIGYSFKEQVFDVFPSFLLALLMAVLVFFVGAFLPFGYFSTFIIQLVFGILMIWGLCELFKLDAYLDIKEIAQSKLKTVLKKK